jgi:PPOX class probable F420-dependent enzyme
MLAHMVYSVGRRGINERDRIRMTAAEIEDFLAGRHTMTMCTLNPDATIHAVAMWYGFLDGNVVITTKAKAQKTLNVLRNPTMTALVEAGEEYGELRGVELVGRTEVVTDPDRMFEAARSVFHRYRHPYTDDDRDAVRASLNKRVVICLHVDRVVSWDHRKLTGDA